MSKWYLLPGYAPSTDYLKNKYLYMTPSNMFCAVLVNIPRKNIIKEFVPVSYHTELSSILDDDTPPPTSKCAAIVPAKEVSVMGAYICWDPPEIASMINEFNQSLDEKYEGVCFFQPHGPGGLVSEDTLLVIHSYDTRFFGHVFSTAFTPKKLFGVKVPTCATYLHHFAIPIHDEEGNIAGGWVPPGDLLCYWDVTHENTKPARKVFSKFLDAARVVINKYRHQATFGEFPKAVLTPVIQAKAKETTRAVERWFRNDGLYRRFVLQYYQKLQQEIERAVDVLKKNSMIEEVNWYEVPLMMQFTIKETEYFSSHTITIEMSHSSLHVEGTSHGKNPYPGLADQEEHPMYFFDKTSYIYTQLALGDITSAAREILNCFTNPGEDVLQMIQIIRGGGNED